MVKIKMCLIRALTRFPVWLQYLLIVMTSMFALLALVWLYRETPEVSIKFHEFYHKNLRGYLFSGFISVGSFLLSLHTFVIVNLKDKLFSTDAYKESYSKLMQINKDDIEEEQLYKPLDNLSAFINTSIWLSILTAISQFTLGLSTNLYACIFCVWIAILTVMFMLHCLIIIRENIRILLKQKV